MPHRDISELVPSLGETCVCLCRIVSTMLSETSACRWQKKSALGGRSFDGHSRPKEDCIAAMLRLLAEAISTGLIPKPLVGMNHLRTTTCKSPGFNTTRIPLKVVLINS